MTTAPTPDTDTDTAADASATGPGAATPAVLLIGASRGLGLAMAAEFVARGWAVTGTVRDAAARTALHDLSDAHPGRVAIETLDAADPGQIAALRTRLEDRLHGRRFRILFHNAGIASTPGHDPLAPAATASDDAFAAVLLTNALAPLRVIDTLGELVAPDGLIGVMSSGQGSVAGNRGGGADIYRASKAALNQLLRSHAARHPAQPLLLMAPGWIRTEMGGPDAPFGLEETVPKIVDVVIAQQGAAGLAFLDREGRAVAW